MKINIPGVLRERPFAVSLSVNFVLFSLVLSFLAPRFMTNDDPVMMLKAAGITLTGEPTPYLLFTHYFIGKILNFLYEITLNIPWYALYLLFPVFIAHTIFLYLLLKISRDKAVLFLYIAYFIFFGFFYILNLQFTVSAFFITTGGYLLIAYTEHKKRLIVFLGMVFIVMGSMIRWESFLLSSGLFLSFYVFWILLEKIKNSHSKIFLTAAGIAFLFHFINMHFYQKSELKDFSEFNSLRVQINDYQVLEKIDFPVKIALLKEAGWTLNEYVMLLKWFFMDEKIYSVEKMEKALQLVKTKTEANRVSLASPDSPLHRLFFLTIFSLFFLTLALLKIARENIIKILMIVLISLIWFILIAYLIKNPPVRIIAVFYSYTVWMLILAVVSAKNTRDLKFSLNHKIAIFILTLLILGANTYQKQKYVREFILRRDFLREQISVINPKKQDYYVSWAGGFPWQTIWPLRDISYLKRIRIFSLDWAQRTEPSKNWLMQNNVENLYTSISESDNIFVIMSVTNVKQYSRYFRVFIKEHYGYEPHFKVIYTNSKFSIGKFSKLSETI